MLFLCFPCPLDDFSHLPYNAATELCLQTLSSFSPLILDPIERTLLLSLSLPVYILIPFVFSPFTFPC